MGSSTTTTVAVDASDEEDATATDATTTVTTGGGGIANLPSSLLINPGSTGFGPTISDKNTGSFVVTGLQNSVNYNVVIAAVDGSGNIGPQTTEVCDFPAPVDDFWKTYRVDGGQAGGSFCALELVGQPVPATAVGALFAGAFVMAIRRRRRSGRRGPLGQSSDAGPDAS